MTGANIVQAERRKKEFTHFYPEAQPIFSCLFRSVGRDVQNNRRIGRLSPCE